MSGYKRFVSYIFSYENGIKKDNVGYARIENHNEECRISIYMKDTIKREQKASVYLFYRDEDKIQGIFMKEMTIKNGLGDCKITTESKNIGGSACGFENIGGIIIYITANRFWGTEWDDKPIYGFEPKKISEQLWKEETIKVDETIAEPVEPELRAAVLEGNMENQWQNIRDESREAMQEEQERYFEEYADCERSYQREYMDCFDPYTRVYPFYDQNKECIGISPKELSQISPILEEWQNNDFLLHGYGRFRHIILLRKKGDSEEYFIGVPGMYRPSEEKLAVTYGFDRFVPMKKWQAEYGDFGYWCTPVKL